MIEFDDYEKAYTQSEDIYKLIHSDAQEIVTKIEDLCGSLKDKWVASDAVPHINKLTEIHKSLAQYLENATSMIVEVSDYVIKVESAVNRISGGVVVGENLQDKFDSNKQEEVEDTKGYKLENLSDEYNLLDDICQSFLTFKNDYAEKFDDFFRNWKEDPRKKRIEDIFNEFTGKMDEYQPVLEESRLALGRVINNTDNIMEG